jgi:transposase
MSNVTHQTESTGAGGVLYMALEVSTTTWHLVTGVGVGRAVRHRVIAAGSREALRDEVRRARARFQVAGDAPVRSCHEAGRDGFWIHRLLTAEGITNVVVDSSSIEVPRRARRAKTDRLDGMALFRKLVQYWGGDRGTWRTRRGGC